MRRTACLLLLTSGLSWAQPNPAPSPSANPPQPAAPAVPQAPPAVPQSPQPPPVVPDQPTGLSLAEAALVALKNHPDLKIAQAQIEQAQASIRQASAPFFPTLNGNVRFNYNEAQSANVGGQQVVRSGGVRNYSMGLSANQLITDFGKTISSVDAADANKEASIWEKDDAVQNLLLRVAESYFTVLRTEQDVLINQENVRNAQVQVERAKAFYEAGTRAKIEVTRAESDLANAQVLLIQAQNSQQKAQVAFVTSLGVKPSSEVLLQEDTLLTAPDWTREQAVSKAEEARPDLLAAFSRVKAAQARVRNAEAQYYPSLSASANYAWSDPSFPPQPYNWGMGITLSIPLINEPSLSAGVQAADANLKQAEGTQELVALQVQQQAAEAWLDLQETRSRVQAAEVALRNNEENYRLASERYNVGVGSSLEVSDAQRLLVQARSQEVQARFDVQLAISRLYRQAGSLTLETLLPPRP